MILIIKVHVMLLVTRGSLFMPKWATGVTDSVDGLQPHSVGAGPGAYANG